MSISPRARMRVHQGLVALWAALTIGTTGWAVWMPDSPYLMAWLIFISCYAVVCTHWAGFEGAAPSAKEDT